MMYIEQLYTGCLSEAAYYVESNGEAAVIDPLRDIEQYIELATQRNATIKYIFETHFHADFVSGHLDLAKATGAAIVFGPQTNTSYEVVVAEDEQEFTIGNISLTAVHTPGHTLESTCWLLKDENKKDHAIFTGDTLFIGDVGRPDLSSGNMDSMQLAGLLYDSLQSKIVPLADDVIVYPAHGAGSSCGKNLSSETSSTIGEQKRSNYALQTEDKPAFISAVLEGLPEAPRYFEVNAKLNKEGYAAVEHVMEKGLQALPLAKFKTLLNDDVIILDTRLSSEFVNGFIPNSVSIGLDGRFAEWAGSLLPFDQPILLVCEPGKEEESVRRLARVGFDKMEGYLDGGFDTWKNAGEEVDLIIEVEADELAMDMPFDDKLVVVDVRNETEYASGHVANAVNLPLKDMNDVSRIAMLPEDGNLYIHCASGYRSVIAASLIRRQGLYNIRNVKGGWNGIREQEDINIEKEKSVLN
jgi:glyoxylase-like metal-dependent hydrolase (beta-lactamase superfamily II)/rhodanese-related sulfurtransferase